VKNCVNWLAGAGRVPPGVNLGRLYKKGKKGGWEVNVLQRALASMTRKKAKSLILLIIVFVLGNIMLSSLVIMQSVDSTREAMLRELPPIVSMQMDNEYIQEKMEEVDDPQEMDIRLPDFDELEEIEEAGRDYIRAYDYSAHGSITTKSLDYYQPEDESTERGMVEDSGEGQYFTLRGAQIPQFTLLEVEEARVSQGRTFEPQEIEEGKPVILMSEELAEENDIMAGDHVLVENKWHEIGRPGGPDDEPELIDAREYEFEVIGLLDFLDVPGEEDHAHGMSDREKYQTLYTTNGFIAELQSDSMEIMRDELPEEQREMMEQQEDIVESPQLPVNFVLNTSEDINDFVDSVEPVIEQEYIKLSTQQDNFQQIAEPLESMRSIIVYSFYIAVGSSILVLTLVLLGFLKDRQKELGIYLALGEKKKKIIAQVVVEALGIGLIGATLALFTGMFVSDSISEMLLATQDMDLEEVSRSSSIMDPTAPRFDLEGVMEQYSVSLSFISIVSYYAVIAATTVLAQLISSTYILRLDPKKIMM